MPQILTKSELAILRKAVDNLEHEAETWADGFAAMRGKELYWPKEHEFAHVRWIKLKSCTRYLRDMIKRHSPKEPEYFI